MELKIIIFILLIVILILYLCNCKKTEHLTISESQTIYDELKVLYFDNHFNLLKDLEDIQNDSNRSLNQFLFDSFLQVDDTDLNLKSKPDSIKIKKAESGSGSGNIINITELSDEIEIPSTQTDEFLNKDYNSNLDDIFEKLLEKYVYTNHNNYIYISLLNFDILTDPDKIILKLINTKEADESYYTKGSISKSETFLKYDVDNSFYNRNNSYTATSYSKTMIINNLKNMFKIKTSIGNQINSLKMLLYNDIFKDFNISEYIIKLNEGDTDIINNINTKVVIDLTSYSEIFKEFIENLEIDNKSYFIENDDTKKIFTSQDNIVKASEFYYYKQRKDIEEEGKSFKQIIETKIIEISNKEKSTSNLLSLIFLINVYKICIDNLDIRTDDYDEILPYLEMYISPELKDSFKDDTQFRNSLETLIKNIYYVKLIDEYIIYKGKPLIMSVNYINYTTTYSVSDKENIIYLIDRITELYKTPELNINNIDILNKSIIIDSNIDSINFSDLKDKKKVLLNNINVEHIIDLLSKGSISKSTITKGIYDYFRADVNDELLRDRSVQLINQELTKILDDGIKKTTGYALQSIDITSDDVKYDPV